MPNLRRPTPASPVNLAVDNQATAEGMYWCRVCQTHHEKSFVHFPLLDEETKANTFIDRLQELSNENVQTAIRKNGDYANPEDPFANFRDCEALGVSIERGILVRTSDKMRRVSNLLDKEPLVTDESIADTLSDLANYALILRIYLESK